MAAKPKPQKRKWSEATRKKVLSKERNTRGEFNMASLKRTFRRMQEEKS